MAESKGQVFQTIKGSDAPINYRHFERIEMVRFPSSERLYGYDENGKRHVQKMGEFIAGYGTRNDEPQLQKPKKAIWHREGEEDVEVLIDGSLGIPDHPEAEKSYERELLRAKGRQEGIPRSQLEWLTDEGSDRPSANPEIQRLREQVEGLQKQMKEMQQKHEQDMAELKKQLDMVIEDRDKEKKRAEEAEARAEIERNRANDAEAQAQTEKERADELEAEKGNLQDTVSEQSSRIDNLQLSANQGWFERTGSNLRLFAGRRYRGWRRRPPMTTEEEQVILQDKRKNRNAGAAAVVGGLLLAAIAGAAIYDALDDDDYSTTTTITKTTKTTTITTLPEVIPPPTTTESTPPTTTPAPTTQPNLAPRPEGRMRTVGYIGKKGFRVQLPDNLVLRPRSQGIYHYESLDYKNGPTIVPHVYWNTDGELDKDSKKILRGFPYRFKLARSKLYSYFNPKGIERTHRTTIIENS